MHRSLLQAIHTMDRTPRSSCNLGCCRACIFGPCTWQTSQDCTHAPILVRVHMQVRMHAYPCHKPCIALRYCCHTPITPCCTNHHTLPYPHHAPMHAHYDSLSKSGMRCAHNWPVHTEFETSATRLPISDGDARFNLTGACLCNLVMNLPSSVNREEGTTTLPYHKQSDANLHKPSITWHTYPR